MMIFNNSTLLLSFIGHQEVHNLNVIDKSNPPKEAWGFTYLDRLQQQARSDRREMVPATLVLLCGEWSRMEFDCPLQLSDKTVDVVVVVVGGWPLAADKVVVVVAVKTLAVGKLASVVVDTVAVELMVRAAKIHPPGMQKDTEKEKSGI